MTFKMIFKWMFEQFPKICEKQLKNISFLNNALQNKMCLGQNAARPSFLNVCSPTSDFTAVLQWWVVSRAGREPPEQTKP